MFGELLQGMAKEAFDLNANTKSALGNKGVLLGLYHLSATPAGSINALGRKQSHAPAPHA